MSTTRLALILGYSYALTATVLFRGVASTSARPAEPRRASAVELAAEVLRSSDRLYAAQVGYGGFNPPQVLAWRIVLLSPRADSIFMDLLRSGTRPGQLYGLAGLRWLQEIGNLDRGSYEAAARGLRTSEEMVPTLIGCIGAPQSVKTLVTEIDSGIWSRELLTGRLQH